MAKLLVLVCNKLELDTLGSEVTVVKISYYSDICNVQRVFSTQTYEILQVKNLDKIAIIRLDFMQTPSNKCVKHQVIRILWLINLTVNSVSKIKDLI